MIIVIPKERERRDEKEIEAEGIAIVTILTEGELEFNRKMK